jgi:hypothetical protein
VSKSLVFQDKGLYKRLVTAQVDKSDPCNPQRHLMFVRRKGLTGSTPADVFVQNIT